MTSTDVSKGHRGPSLDNTPVDTERAAPMLGLQPSTLHKMRLTGDGPPFLKLGRSIRYLPSDLRAWLESRRVQSTSQYPAESGGAR